MHIAVEHTDEVLLQFLIESGGDPWMESSERETTLDVLARIWSRDNRRGDPNEKKLESKTRIFALLEQHWKTKPNHHQGLLLKWKLSIERSTFFQNRHHLFRSTTFRFFCLLISVKPSEMCYLIEYVLLEHST